jgi:hypothetical protein
VSAERSSTVRWPGGAPFAFTVFDDTDRMTLENGPPVYDVLTDLGFRVTKSVWPVEPDGPARTGGATCADPDYLAWVLRLRDAGHEIGLHNASDHPSVRATTIRALDRFEELFGGPPRVGADHVGNLEAMYWGPKRLTGLRSAAYRAAMAVTRPYRPVTSGEDPTSDYFWGDVLRDRIDYWRNFTFRTLDTLAACPAMPYHDPARPYVNWWFGSTHAPSADVFVDLLTPAHLDALAASGGACVIYTHVAMGFAPDGVVDPRVTAVLEDVASRGAWCAPVSEVLDHIRAERGSDAPITGAQRRSLERRWVGEQIRARTASEAGRVLRRVRRESDPWA